MIFHQTLKAAPKIGAAFCLSVLLFTAATTVARAPAPIAEMAQSYVVRINAETVWSHDAQKRLPPASLTKVMVAFLLMEADYRPEKIVTISHMAASATGSRLKIKTGERYTVENLLLGALLASGNDACRALAETYSGSEKKFVARMNWRAMQLGLKNTHFANACGHDAKNHYSTAADLVTLTEIALRNPVFANMVSRSDADISTEDGKRLIHIENRNALIGRYRGAIGVKSGYTGQAGKCVIALAERKGVRVLLVMLNAKNRWWDAHAALDQAFEHASNNILPH